MDAAARGGALWIAYRGGPRITAPAETRDRFDVVIADLFVPWQAGAGALYTREQSADSSMPRSAFRRASSLLPSGLVAEASADATAAEL